MPLEPLTIVAVVGAVFAIFLNVFLPYKRKMDESGELPFDIKYFYPFIIGFAILVFQTVTDVSLVIVAPAPEWTTLNWIIAGIQVFITNFGMYYGLPEFMKEWMKKSGLFTINDETGEIGIVVPDELPYTDT